MTPPLPSAFSLCQAPAHARANTHIQGALLHVRPPPQQSAHVAARSSTHRARSAPTIACITPRRERQHDIDSSPTTYPINQTPRRPCLASVRESTSSPSSAASASLLLPSHSRRVVALMTQHFCCVQSPRGRLDRSRCSERSSRARPYAARPRAAAG